MVYSFARSSFETTWSRKIQFVVLLLLAPKKNLGTALSTLSPPPATSLRLTPTRYACHRDIPTTCLARLPPFTTNWFGLLAPNLPPKIPAYWPADSIVVVL